MNYLSKKSAGWPFAIIAFFLVLASGEMTQAQDLIYGIGGTDAGAGAGPNASALTLFTFLSNAPATTTTVGTVTTTSGYVLESIAMQPTTGVLYGLEYNGAQGQLVSISRTDATLALVGNAFTLGAISGARGNSASIAFNRQTGMLQLVTGAKNNYTVNPTTGALTTNSNLAYTAGDPNQINAFQISSVAFNGNTLFDIDYTNNYLTQQVLTTGTLTSIGPLNIFASQGAGSEGFTFPQRGTLGYLSTSTSTAGGVQDRFYTVNLLTGATVNIGVIGAVTTFNTVDIATAPDAAAAAIPEPGTCWLCFVGLVSFGAVGLRRRVQR